MSQNIPRRSLEKAMEISKNIYSTWGTQQKSRFAAMIYMNRMLWSVILAIHVGDVTRFSSPKKLISCVTTHIILWFLAFCVDSILPRAYAFYSTILAKIHVCWIPYSFCNCCNSAPWLVSCTIIPDCISSSTRPLKDFS